MEPSERRGRSAVGSGFVMSGKVDTKIDEAADKLRETNEKAADKGRDLAHAITRKARDVVEKAGGTITSAGGKIKKWVN